MSRMNPPSRPLNGHITQRRAMTTSCTLEPPGNSLASNSRDIRRSASAPTPPNDLGEYPKRYNRVKELGRGRFGVVYQVKDAESGDEFAAKHIKTRKQEVRDKVRAEIEILDILRHDRIVQILEVFEGKPETIIITEVLSGGELFEKVVSTDFTLTEAEGAHFVKQICQGVEYMHQHEIVHLDLKPENIMLCRRDSNSIKIVDFGLARNLSKEPGGEVRTLCGTPEFVAPEVANYEPVTVAADLWALGVITYVLLSGLSPFLGDNDGETFANITQVKVTFDEEEFDDISDEGKSFIGDLLVRAPSVRPSAQKCLDHKWLKLCRGQSVYDKNGTLKKLDTTNLRKFLARRRWQKCGQAIRALKRISSLRKIQTPSSLMGSSNSYGCKDNSAQPSFSSIDSGFSASGVNSPERHRLSDCIDEMTLDGEDNQPETDFHHRDSENAPETDHPTFVYTPMYRSTLNIVIK